MLYQKAHVENGKIIIDATKQVGQTTLTGDCFMIQINGLDECKSCEFKDTDECGGGETLAKLTN